MRIFFRTLIYDFIFKNISLISNNTDTLNTEHRTLKTENCPTS